MSYAASGLVTGRQTDYHNAFAHARPASTSAYHVKRRARLAEAAVLEVVHIIWNKIRFGYLQLLAPVKCEGYPNHKIKYL